MIDAVRIVHDWWQHKTYGVNAMIETLDLDSGVVQVPPVSEFKNEFDDTEVARRDRAVNVPAIWTFLDDPILLAETVPTGQKQGILELPVTARYIIRGVDRKYVRRDTILTLQAMLKSVNNLLLDANQASRIRNNVCLTGLENVTLLELREDVGDAVVTGAIICTFRGELTDPT